MLLCGLICESRVVLRSAKEVSGLLIEEYELPAISLLDHQTYTAARECSSSQEIESTASCLALESSYRSILNVRLLLSRQQTAIRVCRPLLTATECDVTSRRGLQTRRVPGPRSFPICQSDAFNASAYLPAQTSTFFSNLSVLTRLTLPPTSVRIPLFHPTRGTPKHTRTTKAPAG